MTNLLWLSRLEVGDHVNVVACMGFGPFLYRDGIVVAVLKGSISVAPTLNSRGRWRFSKSTGRQLGVVSAGGSVSSWLEEP